MSSGRNTLVVITGATASGKSAFALELAQRLGCHIISADSRQIYKHIPIVTAVPTAEELSAVPHHFVQQLELDQYYSAASFENDVIRLLETELWKQNGVQILCGGSMMYVDAVTKGLDVLPTVSDNVRVEVMRLFADGGITAIRNRLELLDPWYLQNADTDNHKRLMHALEICIEAGVPYSSLRTGKKANRPFDIIKVYIDMPRDILFGRINDRVERMVAAGLEDEVKGLYPLRELNSLNTVGVKEIFAMIDGKLDRETAISRIAKNTRVYAKKQLTWIKRDAAEYTALDYRNPMNDFLNNFPNLMI